VPSAHPLTDDGVAPELRGVRRAWASRSDRIWPAWQHLPEWEICSFDDFGPSLGSDLLVLWALYTFSDVDVLLTELVDGEGRPTFGDPLIEDMVSIAFALGAAWAASREAPTRARTRRGAGE